MSKPHGRRGMRFVLFAICAVVAAFAVRQNYLASVFSDVTDTHPYAEAIGYLRAQGIVSGYADRSFRPDVALTRAEFARLVTKAVAPVGAGETCVQTFRQTYGQRALFLRDVPPGEWYEGDLCYLMGAGIVTGNADRTFLPGSRITLAEASKMLAVAFGLQTGDAAAGARWYEPYVRALADRHALPVGLLSVTDTLSRGMSAEMFYRLHAGVVDRPSLAPADLDGSLLHAAPTAIAEQVIRLINEKRIAAGLPGFRPNDRLARAALAHAKDMKDRGYFAHVTPDDVTTEARIRATGYFDVDRATCNCTTWTYAYGETLSQDGRDIRAAIDGFFGSPVHRKILLGDFDEAGVGIEGENLVVKVGKITLR